MDEAALLAELAAVDDQLQHLNAYRQTLAAQLTDLHRTAEDGGGAGGVAEVACSATNSDAPAQSEASLSPSQKAAMDHVRGLAASRLGVPQLRQVQAAALRAMLAGEPQAPPRDVVVIAPTGAGKSLVFQLSALVEGGLTIVISPLLALMADQVAAMQQAGIGAVCLSSSDAPEALKAGLAQLDALLVNTEEGSAASANPTPPLRLLYITPERAFASKRLLAKLEALHHKKRVARLVVDEAHCLSAWGFDFRPAYLQLHRLRKLLPGVPLLALTATASAPVVADIVQQLELVPTNVLVLRAPTHRANLVYSVHTTSTAGNIPTQATYIAEWVAGHWPQGCGIVYALSRKDVEQLSAALTAHGLSAKPYHAWMSPQQRLAVQTQWMAGTLRVVVATVAFGLGINKPDVRFVIHAALPKGLDAYYQESGRAGRDGLRADCLLLWQPADVCRVGCMVCTDHGGIDSLYAVARYAANAEGLCRRQRLARHFHEQLPADACRGEQACDVCRSSGGGTKTQVDMTDDAKILLRLVQRLAASEQSATLKSTINMWRGNGRKNVNLGGDTLGKCRSDAPIVVLEGLVVDLILRGVLKQRFHQTPYSTLSYIVPGRQAVKLEKGQVQVVVPAWDNSGKGGARMAKRGKAVVHTEEEEEEEEDDDFVEPAAAPKEKVKKVVEDDDEEDDETGRTILVDDEDDE